MIVSILRTGWMRVRDNLRLVALAWGINLAMALVVALPFLNELESYLAPTVRDEEILLRLDENWLATFHEDLRSSPYARLLDHSVLGAAPFIHHLDGMLSGRVISSIADFVWDSVTGLEFATRHLSLLVVLALVYGLSGMLLSGGFLGAYASAQRVTIAEFIADGARFFGRMFRVALVGFVLLYVVLGIVGPLLRHEIASSTSGDASEWTAYLLYLATNAVLLMLFWLITLALDYTRVRIVLEDRGSVLGAFGSGLAFVVRNWKHTLSVSLALVAVTVMLMVVFGLLAETLTVRSAPMLIVLVLAQQAYMFARSVVRAGTYACEVEVFRAV
ncbi:MAG: hypothetical protein MUF82_00980 [Bacteroidetes bacterium]|nr:hypothetical protein [Bacteroidota bacterium]